MGRVTMPFFAGLDFGQAADFSDLVVLDAGPEQARAVLAKRFRGLPHSQAVECVVEHLGPFRDVLVLFDRTGVGRPVGDLLRLRAPRLRTVGVTISGGSRIHGTADGLTAPKRVLTQTLAALLGSGRIEIPAGPLADELRLFGRKVDARTGHERFEARRGHDDLTIALALASLPIRRRRTWAT